MSHEHDTEMCRHRDLDTAEPCGRPATEGAIYCREHQPRDADGVAYEVYTREDRRRNGLPSDAWLAALCRRSGIRKVIRQGRVILDVDAEAGHPRPEAPR
jgi:hypothetical protein